MSKNHGSFTPKPLDCAVCQALRHSSSRASIDVLSEIRGQRKRQATTMASFEGIDLSSHWESFPVNTIVLSGKFTQENEKEGGTLVVAAE